MPDIIWLWWLFQLFLIFLYDMSFWILGIIFFVWVAKVGLSQRHRHNSLTQYRIKDSFFQDRFYEERLRNEKSHQDYFLDR
jgi:hypothetical protein